MRVIARNTLVAFAKAHPETRSALERWFTVVRSAEWMSMNEVKSAFSGAKVLNAERARFEVAGGNYRLIAAFDFRRQTVFVKFLGTHTEYDNVNALTVSQFQEIAVHIRPIRSDADHRAALAEIERLWGASPGTDDGDKLEILITLVEKYEESRWPINEPDWDPADVLRYAIDEMGHTQTELAALLGSRSRASEILNRQRPLTVEMIRSISDAWKIPAQFLIRPYRSDAA
jgi:antitoxin component HigA of HigAB toxin-antitoxin module/mRNA-degrading endonuclease HigB of HigAB toxin-antitoxin module